jgi:hypothetical protein
MLWDSDDMHPTIITMRRRQSQESCPVSGRIETQLTERAPSADRARSSGPTRAIPEIPDCDPNVR